MDGRTKEDEDKGGGGESTLFCVVVFVCLGRKRAFSCCCSVRYAPRFARLSECLPRASGVDLLVLSLVCVCVRRFAIGVFKGKKNAELIIVGITDGEDREH